MPKHAAPAPTGSAPRRWPLVIALVACVLIGVGVAVALGTRRAPAPAEDEPTTTLESDDLLAPIPDDPTMAPALSQVVCLGDSITYGLGVEGNRDTQAWPAVLNHLLGNDWEVINLGVSGVTLQNEADYPYASTGSIDYALNLQPDVYLLMLGTNDTRRGNWNEARFHSDYEALVKQLTDSSWPHELVLMTPPRVFHDGSFTEAFGSFDDGLIGNEVRSIVKQVAAEHGLTCLDLYALTEEHPEWFDDKVHPNAEGNQQIATYIYDQLWGKDSAGRLGVISSGLTRQ